MPWKHVTATEKINFPLFRSYTQMGWTPRVWSAAVRFVSEYNGPIALVLVFGAVLPGLLLTIRRERRVTSWGLAALPLLAVAAFAATPGGAGFFFHGALAPRLQATNLRYGSTCSPCRLHCWPRSSADCGGPTARLPSSRSRRSAAS